MNAVTRHSLRFLIHTGLALLASGPAPLCAKPAAMKPLAELAPATDKALAPDRIAALTARGAPSVWRTAAERAALGIPAGGIGSGTVYLGADGRLWCWDIFNANHEGVVPNLARLPEDAPDAKPKVRERDGANYVNPPRGESPWNIDNGCTLRFADGAERTVDAKGFRDIAVKGEYPAVTYTYADPACPVAVTTEAVSPFIPLEYDDSSLPVVYLVRTFTNRGDRPVTFTVRERLENAAVKTHGPHDAIRRHRRPLTLPGAAGMLGEVVSANGAPPPAGTLARADYGTVALAMLGDGATDGEALAAMTDTQLLRVTGREITLAPGASATVTTVVAWHFPHAAARITRGRGALPDGRRWVAGKFPDAGALLGYAVENAGRIIREVRLFRDTWYGSESGADRGTLPHWLLERALWTASTLTTNVSYRLVNDRFWAWEGVGACEGVCTHVWHYAQSPGRLFPKLERDLREHTDFVPPAMGADGAIDFRGGMAGMWAIDGQAGTVLRAWRQHCVDTSGDFLAKNWPAIQKATRFLITFDAGKDGKPDGVPTGSMHNTLDANWSGTVPWFVSMYNASLIAAAAMADEVGDQAFAAECRAIVAQGRTGYARLFDPAAGFYMADATEKQMMPIHVGKGCHIDMALGDWWLSQTGLPAFGDRTRLRAAMNALFDHNFVPHMGAFRRAWDRPHDRGRPYAIGDESGLVMCTWPQNGLPDACRNFWSFGYFQECMSGFEYSAAGLMVALAEDERDPLLTKGLTVTRAVHDRYAADRRNPYNEIECSDHYARAMASYGVFLAACGFHTHEPTGLLRFDPKIRPDDFAAPFIAGGGWGRYGQRRAPGRFAAELEVRHGAQKVGVLELRTGLPADAAFTVATADGAPLAHAATLDAAGLTRLTLAKPLTLKAGETLRITAR